MAQSFVTADLHLALDVLAHLAAQVTFDLEVLVDVGTEPRHLLVGEVADGMEQQVPVLGHCLEQVGVLTGHRLLGPGQESALGRFAVTRGRCRRT